MNDKNIPPCPFCGRHLEPIVIDGEPVTHMGVTAMRHPFNDCILFGIKVIGPKDLASWGSRVGKAKDAAYRERNMLVAALAKLFPSGIRRTPIDGWEPEWFNCVYIELPTGQISWHYHDDEKPLFKNLVPYWGKYDGHTTEEKYRRLGALKVDWRGTARGQ